VSFGLAPDDLNQIVTPVVSRFKKYLPRGFRRMARRYRTWVPAFLALAALSLIVIGIMNPVLPSE
jgi:hypothetical protein